MHLGPERCHQACPGASRSPPPCGNTQDWGRLPRDPALRALPASWPIPKPYLEMSPQYHSASCREGGLPPLARPAGVGFALGGLGGSAEGQEKMHIEYRLYTVASSYCNRPSGYRQGPELAFEAPNNKR